MNNIRILASDTATKASGWAVLDIITVDNEYKIKYIDSGTLYLKGGEFSKRFKAFYDGFKEQIINKYFIKKDGFDYHLAIEDVFVGENPQSALKLAKIHGIPISFICELNGGIFYYHPTTIKKVTTGDASAAKKQVARSVSKILGIPLFDDRDHDRSDACAVGLTHIMRFLAKVNKKRF